MELGQRTAKSRLVSSESYLRAPGCRRNSAWCLSSGWLRFVCLSVATLIALGLGVSTAQAQATFTDAGFFTQQVAQVPPFTAVGMEFAPDGRIFVWQKNGIIRIIKNGQMLPAPFLDISSHVNNVEDRGLLGFAFDPNFSTNGYIYLAYTYEETGNQNDPGPKTARLVRVQADPTNPDLALPGETVILGSINTPPCSNFPAGSDCIGSDSLSHTVGSIHFAPDGKMFVSIGDGAGFDTTDVLAFRAQDLNDYDGKILRINPDGTAPTDNPFYDGTNSHRSKVWAYGLRNPYRFSLHPTNGDPYIGDVGWSLWEEVDRAPKGANLGWPCFEGNDPQQAYQTTFPARCSQVPASSVTFPLYTYSHADPKSDAVIGGVVYTGTQFPPQYQGNYFFFDFHAGWMRRITLDAAGNFASIADFGSGFAGPVHLELGPDGSMYYIEILTGAIGKIVFGPNQPPVAKASATPAYGFSPLNVAFSSAGTFDPQGTPLTYFWDFGDGTTSTLANPSHTYSGSSVVTFAPKLTVTNGNGISSSVTLSITLNSVPPVPTISTPADGTHVNPGQTVVFQGSAVDPVNGPLPPSALSWEVLLHHNDHVHEFGTFFGSQGSLVVPNPGADFYALEIILTATESSGLTAETSVFLPVNIPGFNLDKVNFSYADRASLLADGWSYAATTASGTTRNTEITSGSLAVSYDQTAHPLTIRIPLGSGEMWQSSNNSQNTLFRNLPSDWSSIRLRIFSFNPSANYQQVGLLAYQDDDNYVNVNRPFVDTVGGQTIEMFQEKTQATTYINRTHSPGTGNLLLRIDRDVATSTYTGYFSTDDGNTWQTIGSTVVSLNNPKLAIQVGSDVSGTVPNISADLSWVEILRPLPAAPSLTSITPASAEQGFTLNTVLAGANFASGITCDFGAGITVNSCTLDSSTQLTANLTVFGSAAVGPRDVTVTNLDGQSSTLVGGFTVDQFVAQPAPVLNSVTPNSANPGQNLNVVLAGTNFASGATCSFGAGITVNICTFNSTTQMTANISLAGNAAAGARNVTLTNPDSQSSTLVGGFTVVAPSGVLHLDFNYPDRAALLAASWDYLARTAAGGTRNTEVTAGALTVSYDQTAHPGVIRTPLGSGEMWQSSNNSQNTLFRDPPAGWTSLRLKIAAFNPTANYQQVGLIAYQNDDNYVLLNRSFVSTNGGQLVELFKESGQATTYANRLPVTNTGNLILRLDRNATTNTYTGFYSLDGGASWALVGSTTLALTNIRLGIQVGTDLTGTVPVADLSWVEVLLPGPPPAPKLTSVSPTSGTQGQSLNVVLAGTNFASGATCAFGAGITVNSCAFNSATQLTANVTIAGNATVGTRDVTVTNPDAQSSTLTAGFSVTTAPAPTVGSVNPTSGTQGQSESVVIAGTSFLSGATCSFGTGITVNSCAFNSATQLTANVTISGSATLGTRDITITNPNGQSGTLTGGFSVIAPPVPVLSSVNPTSGAQGQTLNVILAGSNFASGATCSFGAGITVNSCAFNSATQLTAGITIASTAATGARDVTVTNPGGQSSTLTGAFTVTLFVPPPGPVVSGATPNSGNPGQNLNVVLAGTNFASGATCSFGAGITVNTCTFNSSTQMTANISLAGNAAAGARNVTVTNPNSQSGTLTGGFTVVAPSGALHLDFTYPTRSALLASSWDYLARTAAGATRNTEVTSGTLVVSYDQTAHPGTIRIPIGLGENWQSSNNSQNTLFRDPPVGWTSLRLRIGAFNPTANYQQVGIVAYQDDDNYVDVSRGFNTSKGGQLIEMWKESAQATTYANQLAVTNTGNLILRLDRDATTNTYTGFYSLDGGTTWTLVGSTTLALTNVRLAIHTGSDLTGTTPVADLSWVEVLLPGPPPAPKLTSVSPTSGTQGQSLNVVLAGTNFASGATCAFGAGITVNSCAFNSATQLTASVTIAGNATVGTRDVTVTNPDAQSSTLTAGFSVTTAPAPSVTGANPASGGRGQTLSMVLTGSNFVSGATCSFGTGITVNSCAFNSATQLTANVTISGSATLGTRDITITNPNGQSGTLTAGFSVQSSPAPTLTTLSPTAGAQGQSLDIVLSGSNFLSGATCSFGAGVTVNSCTFNSPTQLVAHVAIASNATLGTRTATVTNSDGQGTALTDGFSVTQSAATQNTILTVAVLVNSANGTGYNTSATTPGEFQRYVKPYLDHLQVPYEIIDTATTAPPASLSSRQLILAGHTGLVLSAAWQSAISSAVSGGTGFVNLDADPNVGAQTHIQTIFGASGSSAGTPASSIVIPAAEIPGGATPHFIDGLQRKFLGDAPGDIVYNFHPDSNGVVQTVTPTVLTGANGTVVAQLGSAPLILATSAGAGRAVNFGSYLYLKADRFGFVQGVDDLFWRSLVWAARKPFVLRGYPRYWAVQMDDTMPGWAARVRDLYDTSLTGTTYSNGTGGPWKVTGYLFTNNLAPGSADRASMIADINAGKLRVVPHSFGNVKYGDMYWNASTGPLTDAQWSTNLAAITAWKTGNGGADTVPSIGRTLVAHYWDISNNTGADLWNTLGIRYITTIQQPGVQFPDSPSDITVYTGNGSERLHDRDFWQYELPPKSRPDENFPMFFADDFTIGSRSGLAPKTFFLFLTQYIDFSKYPRPDWIWPSPNYSQSIDASLDQLKRYIWRHWSGMSPVQVFTHDIVNYEFSPVPARLTVIGRASQWLAANGARGVFMDDIGDYLYARNKSVLVDARLASGSLQLTFSGSAATADGALIPTQAQVFYPDLESVPVTVAGFTSVTTTSIALPAQPARIDSITPASGPTAGGTSVTILGANFSGVTAVLFDGVPATTFTVSGTNSIAATTPGGFGPVDVTVQMSTGAAERIAGFAYRDPDPPSGHFDFTYANRTALLAAGWSYVAKTATGGTRDTEQGGTLTVSYDQTAHPGTIRIPLGSGEDWQTSNNSQNQLFRGLPVNWTSIRLKIASFNPTASYQQVGLMVYQDDDNYINLNRAFVGDIGGADIELFREAGGGTQFANRLLVTNTGNLILRLDRDISTNVYTGFYSTDGGTSWIQVGSLTLALTNPRLAIQAGANLAGTTPTADLAWVEIQP